MTSAVLATAIVSFGLTQSLTVPLLPLLQERFGADQSASGWVITAPLLSAAVATPILGRLGDAYGKHLLLVIVLGGLVFGAVVAAVASSMSILIISRLIQGCGGGVLPLAFGIIRDEFPPERARRAISATSSLMAVGFGFGLVLSAPLYDLVGYQLLFIIPGLIAAGAGVAAHHVIPPSPSRAPGGVSVLPAIALTVWLTALLVAVSQAPNWGWTSSAVLGLGALSFLGCALWVLAERQAKAPLIDVRMMRLRSLWPTNLAAFFIGASTAASLSYIPLLLQVPTASGYGLGLAAWQAGAVMVPGVFLTFLAGLIGPALSRRFGAKNVVISSCVVAAFGTAGTAAAHDNVVAVAVGVGLIGAAVGLLFGILANLTVSAVRPDQTGVAGGLNANLRTVGGAIGSAIAASIVLAHMLPGGYPSEAGYVVTLFVLAAVMAVAAAVSLFIPIDPVTEDQSQGNSG